jgi:hypothetical protein
VILSPILSVSNRLTSAGSIEHIEVRPASDRDLAGRLLDRLDADGDRFELAGQRLRDLSAGGGATAAITMAAPYVFRLFIVSS